MTEAVTLNLYGTLSTDQTARRDMQSDDPSSHLVPDVTDCAIDVDRYHSSDFNLRRYSCLFCTLKYHFFYCRAAVILL